jgi:G:T-mismatch repair DNA endonuclease (very short patch repair protein)
MRTKYKFDSLSRARKRRILMPKKPRQTFVIADNGKKIKCGTSVSEAKWLDKLGILTRSKVIILFGKTFVVDGYDPKTMTCYEFNGDYWHGSHKVYPNNRDVIDKWLKKSPNQLYQDTLNRYNLFYQAGFKIFFVWESDYKKGFLGRYYKGSGDNLY